jgi:hypothetical protein
MLPDFLLLEWVRLVASVRLRDVTSLEAGEVQVILIGVKTMFCNCTFC